MRRPVGPLAAMALFMALLASCFGARAAVAAAPGEFMGVNLQPLQMNSSIASDRWGSFLQPLADGQMTVNRIQADWGIIEPTAPKNGVHTWQWNTSGWIPAMDWTFTQLANRGLRAVPTLNNSPGWARGGGSNLPDSSFSGFADFSIAFIGRYGENGSFWKEHPELPYLPATQFELWNEANSGNFWTGKADAAAYARFLNVVYPKVKAAAPNAMLMSSIGWPDAANYLAALFANKAGNSMDAVAFHPYSPTARSMMLLVNGLRSTLSSLGRGDMPIWITESGQPANYSGTGTLHAFDGPVNDSTRAATQALTAEALAHSDCGVDSFLVYAITGSETEKEILHEGFMGILRIADASPNATGLALQRASQRWVSASATGAPTPNGQLIVCGQGTTPPAALLPLTLSGARGSSGGCVAAQVGFDGNPLEEADFVLTTPDGRVSRNGTNAAGQTESCVPAGPAVDHVDVYAEVHNVARSPTLRCDIPVTTCGGGMRQAAPSPCIVKFTLTKPVRDRVGKRATTKGKARLQCDAYRSTKRVKVKVKLHGKTKAGKPRSKIMYVQKLINPRFSLAYKVTGKKRETRLRYITLVHGKTVTFRLHRVIKKGDLISVVHRANPKKDRLPRLRVSVKMTKPKAPKRVKHAATTTKSTTK